MATYSYDTQPEKKKRRTRWLIGCGAGALVTICIVLFIIFGGFAGLIALFGGEPEGLSVDVQTPGSKVLVGDTFTISIALANEGTQNITISEIQLPNGLLEIALVTGVDPSGIQGLDYGDQTAYGFNMLIAPNGRQTVTFTFEAIQAGDVTGNLDVQVGTKTTSAGVRVIVSPATAVDGGDREPVLGEVIPYQSVVQIIAIVDLNGELVPGWSGSGTIISNDGMILTNAHVVLSDRYYSVVDLIVSITIEQDQPPQQMFYADVVQADADLDLAVIKVRSDLDGGAANFSSLEIEPVPLGSSESLELGDPLVIIGYPSIGGETITLTRGEVSGFTAEEPYGSRAYIKTSATIAGGNSGGLAATPQGEIIGVPTAVGTGDLEDAFVDCRPLADTNRDGIIDETDNCVPTGGFINALRPIQLALPMIEAAQAGEVAINEDTGGGTQEEYDPEGDVILSDDFSSNVNNWSLGEFSDSRSEISGGQLVINIFTDGYISWSTLPGSYNTPVMVVNAQVLSPVGDSDFGFICGLQDQDNFTALEISEDGYYTIYKFENDQQVSLVDWTYSDMVAAGGPFTLVAYCGPDRLALAVNDTLLAETVDPDYNAGNIGLVAGSYENPNVRIGFDDFFILQP